MPIGPRDKPSPLILHINSTTNAPAKIAEASAIFVTSLSAVTVSATNYLGLNGAGSPAGPDVGLVQYYLNSTNFGADPTFKYIPETKTLNVSSVSSTNSSSVIGSVGVLTANTILNPGSITTANINAAYGTISELSSGIVSATTYVNLPSSTLIWKQAQDIVLYVKNNKATPLPKGTPVAIVGAVGDNPLVEPLSSVNTHVPEAIGFSNHVAGLVQETITGGGFGYIVVEGIVVGTGADKLDTNSFNSGDWLYVSSNGQLNNVRPPAPYESHPVGIVLRPNQNNGVILVKIENVSEINDIVGFNLNTNLINGDLIVYDRTTSTFVNRQSIDVSGLIKGGSLSATNLSSTNARLTSLSANSISATDISALNVIVTSGLTFSANNNALVPLSIRGPATQTQILRFNDLSGNEQARFNHYATKNSTFLGFQSGFSNNNTAGQNIGVANIGIGPNTLVSNVSGNHNIAIGFQAQSNSLGSDVISLGNRACQNATSSINIVAIGQEALLNPVGDRNIGIGYRAGYGLSSLVSTAARNNISIGYLANGTGTNQFNDTIVIGSGTDATADNQTIIGHPSTSSTILRGAVTANTSINSPIANFTNNSTTPLTLSSTATNLTQLVIRHPSNQSAPQIAFSDPAGSRTFRLYSSFDKNTLSVGRDAGFSNFTTSGISAGIGNTYLGDVAGQNNVSGNYNTFLGFIAGEQNRGTGGVAVGYQAMFNNNGTASNNVAIGQQALRSSFNNPTGGGNIGIGLDANGFLSGTGSTNNVAIGHNANNVVSNQFSSLTNTIAIGANSRNTASNQTVIGNSSTSSTILFGAVTANTSINSPTANFTNNSTTPLTLSSTASINQLVIRHPSGVASPQIFFTDSTGNESFRLFSSWNKRTLSVGTFAGNLNFTTTGINAGVGNTNIGDVAAQFNVSGNFNTCIGFQAGENHQGNNSVAVGYQSMVNNNTSSNDNIAVGRAALRSSLNNPTGGGNIGIGFDANGFLSGTGSTNNVALGHNANSVVSNQYSSLTNTIAIGANSRNTASNQTVIGNSSTSSTIIFGTVSASSVSATNISGTNYFGLPSSPLSGLADTSITTGNIATGRSLVWNGSRWQPSSITGGATSLSSLLDTSVGLDANTNPSGNQALVYSSSVNRWYPGYTVYQQTSIPSNSLGKNGDIYFQYDQSSTLSGLSDTAITNPGTGQVLAWNASKWVASSITGGGGGSPPVGSNYQFQFFNNNTFSSIPGVTLGSVYSPTDRYFIVSSINGAYIQGALISQFCNFNEISLYPVGSTNNFDRGYIVGAPAGVSAVSANALITPSLSATTVSATTYRNTPTELHIICSDETSDLTTGTAKITFRMPYAMTLTNVRANVNTAPVGSTIIVNIKEAGVSIFSTRLTIAAGSKTSVGGTPHVFSDTSLADDAEMTIDIDQVGSTTAGKGLKVWLIGNMA